MMNKRARWHRCGRGTFFAGVGKCQLWASGSRGSWAILVCPIHTKGFGSDPSQKLLEREGIATQAEAFQLAEDFAREWSAAQA